MKSAHLGRSLGRTLCQQRSYSVVHDVPQTATTLSHNSVPTPPQRTSSILEQAANATAPRSSWTKDEITEIHQTPLMELAFTAVRTRYDALQSNIGAFVKAQPTTHLRC